MISGTAIADGLFVASFGESPYSRSPVPGEASVSDLRLLDHSSADISVPQIELEEAEQPIPADNFDIDSLSHYPYQVFVLSEYGRPVYVSCGYEEQLCSLFALIGIFVNRVRHWDDQLHSISTSGLHVHFQYRKPLILCIVSKKEEQLSAQLDVLFDQILSTLSRNQLETIYEKRGDNYDLRKLLRGTDKYMNSCVAGWRSDISQLSSAIRIFPLQSVDREFMSTTIASCITNAGLADAGVLFGIVIAHRQLVTLVRLKKYTVHQKDLHILMNLIANNTTLHNYDTWMPICLPHFNDTGFVHAFVSYLWDDSPACLMLLSVKRDAFSDLHSVRQDIVNTLELNPKAVSSLKASLASPQVFSISNIGNGAEQLWHFAYKNRSSQQICVSSAKVPFVSRQERKYLLDNVSRTYHLIRTTDHMRAAFVRRKNDVLLIRLEDRFELQCVFSPFVSSESAWVLSDRLLKALKSHELKYFMKHLVSF